MFYCVFNRILQSDLSDETRQLCKDLNDSLAIKVPTQKMSGLHTRITEETRNERYIPLRTYRKVPKFSYTRKLCCNLPRIQTKSPNLTVFSQEDANGIANSEDPDQTAPLGAV